MGDNAAHSKNNRLRRSLGKTPSEVALSVMTIVTESLGQQSNPAGLSTLDKLLSLQTDPAVQVLRKTDWREFFHNYQKSHAKYIQHKASEPVGEGFDSLEYLAGHQPHQKTQQRKKATARTSPQNNTSSSFDQEKLEAMRDIRTTFVQLVKRVEILWEELKFSETERSFFRDSLCSFSSSSSSISLEQCREVSAYLCTLLQYRSRTIQTLHAISLREHNANQCFDLLDRIHQLAAIGLAQHASANQWSPALTTLLQQLQDSTRVVVNMIQLWRKELWRPLPFIWKGENYLNKIASDVQLLDDKKAFGLFAPIALESWKLLTDIDPSPSDNLDGTAPIGSGISLAQASQIDESVPLTLEECSKVVRSESVLQRAILMEKRQLRAKGVFIPTVRLSSFSVMDDKSGLIDMDMAQENITLPSHGVPGIDSSSMLSSLAAATTPAPSKVATKLRSETKMLSTSSDCLRYSPASASLEAVQAKDGQNLFQDNSASSDYIYAEDFEEKQQSSTK